jgi:molybdopterin converting factor subunit 1
MELEIRLFATLKDLAGQNRIRLTIPETTTVHGMLQLLAAAYPALSAAAQSSIVAVNRNYASPETPIGPDDEVAIFPPVSGGEASHNPTYFAITRDKLDIDAIHEQLTRPDVGAIVSFRGSVRGQTRRQGLPDDTLYLEYEAYASMAEAKMALIASEIWERWPLVKGIAIVQRIGRLDIGEVTTFIACAAGHRDQGVFDAAHYGIDRLKEIVPVWKREVGSDRSIWVEGHYHPTEQDN